MAKDILIVLDHVGRRAAPFGLTIAREFGAAVTAVSVADTAPLETLAYAEVTYDLITPARAEARRQAETVASEFAAAAREANVEAETLIVDETSLLAGAALVERARISDLVVIEQSDPDREKPTDAHLEDILVKSGRPTLVVPYVQRAAPKLDVVMVAWDGSRQAARALGDSIPFLQRASRVQIVTIADEAQTPEKDADGPMLAHLARHMVYAELRRLVSGIPITETLLSHAADVGADLIVMGAYGHSRVREAILGGASRNMLRSMTVPVLMSH